MEKFSVEKEVQFDMGHRVPFHKSKCRNPHGHRYRVIVCVEGSLQEGFGESDQGMVMDFSDIKRVLTESIHDVYDHGFMIYDRDAHLEWFFFPGDESTEKPREGWNLHKVPFVPTAENLSAYFYGLIAAQIDNGGKGVRVKWVRVFETPTSVAQYPSI